MFITLTVFLKRSKILDIVIHPIGKIQFPFQLRRYFISLSLGRRHSRHTNEKKVRLNRIRHKFVRSFLDDSRVPVDPMYCAANFGVLIRIVKSNQE